MIDKDIENLLIFLKNNFNIKNMNDDEKNKFKYLYEEIANFTNEIPSAEKLEKLKNIEVGFETKYEELYELGNYFDPVFIKMKKIIHENNTLKIREKNKKKREENL